MSLDPTDKRPRRRRLSEDEHRLWSGVVRSVVPLKRKPAPRHAAPVTPDRGPQGVRRRAEPEPVRHATPKPAIKAVAAPPPVSGLDRRQKQRLARGRESIDARIDLHGKTQSEAHAVLLGFLRRVQAEGGRFVLVITGKGGPSGAGTAGERGVLKRQVPQWLRQAEFRSYVLAAEDAHRIHGGEGALYIRLRRSGG